MEATGVSEPGLGVGPMPSPVMPPLNEEDDLPKGPEANRKMTIEPPVTITQSTDKDDDEDKKPASRGVGPSTSELKGGSKEDAIDVDEIAAKADWRARTVSISIETLKEFKNILLGQKLIVQHTDHKNLLYQKMSTNPIIQWRLLLEEFGPIFLHVKGEKNVIADALSRLDADFNETLPTEPMNDSMAYIFLTEKDIKETDFPLSPILIGKYQQLEKQLKRKLMSTTNQNFSTKTIEGVEVITYQGKIYIPVQLQQRIVAWYHEYLAHPGKS